MTVERFRTPGTIFLRPVHFVWRICEGLVLLTLYILSISWGDFGTTRPMIQDTMLFGAHLFAAVEDITLSCEPKVIENGSEKRDVGCAQLFRSLLLATVCVTCDCAAFVTQAKHVSDDDDDTLYAVLAFLCALVLTSALARFILFLSQWLIEARYIHSDADRHGAYTFPTSTGTARAPPSARRAVPGAGRTSTIGYDEYGGVPITARQA